jgi:hypothetical protein
MSDFFVSFHDRLAPYELVGGKFFNLHEIQSAVTVPHAFCLTSELMAAALTPLQMSPIAEFFADAHATLGTFLREAYPRLAAALRDLTPLSEHQDLIWRRLREEFPGDRALDVAVRSSAIGEDGTRGSFAGAYRTVLNVSTREDLFAAISTCWRSYYEMPAIMSRLRAGDFSPAPRMALIIQEMVSPGLAGVAVSGTPASGVGISFASGVADGLVSGRVPGQFWSEGTGLDFPEPHGRALAAVHHAVKILTARRQQPLDVEWAWSADTLFVLQARPLTDRRLAIGAVKHEPHLEVGDLYFDDRLPPGVSLGACTEVYQSYVQKRSWAYRLARRHGVAVGRGWVLSFNGHALRDRARVLTTLQGVRAPQLVLDFGTRVRQMVIPSEQLSSLLAETFPSDPEERHTVLVREFTRGAIGFITRLLADGRLLIEYSVDGLLAINRGLARCDRMLVSRQSDGSWQVDGSSDDIARFASDFPHVDGFTRALNQERPGTQLEWVLAESSLFVDFSTFTGESEAVATTCDGTVCVSEGVSGGPGLLVDDDQLLERMSIGPAVSVGASQDVLVHLTELVERVKACPAPPIVVARRPYAILATMIGAVAGFVFEEGSLLCHLALMLRESGTPAVIAPALKFRPGQKLRIADGLVWAEADGERSWSS